MIDRILIIKNIIFTFLIFKIKYIIILLRCLADALDVASQNKDTIGINLVIRKCDPNTQKALIDKAKALKASLNFRVS